MITSENTRGSTSKIRVEWQELIGVELGKDITVKHLAYVNRVNFNEYLNDRNVVMNLFLAKEEGNKILKKI